MSARSQRGNHDTSASKRLHSPRVNPKNRGPRPHITYDYDAAISQPDVPSLIDYKKLGRGAMVSGVLLKKRNLKKRIKPRKNFQKRSQESKMKSLAQKKGIRLPGSKTGNPANKTVGSSNNFDKDHVDIKEDIINDTIDDLSNILKDTTIEATENENDSEIIEEKIKNPKLDDFECVATKSPITVKCSKIPRAKITIFPAHTLHESHATKLKIKESLHLKHPTTGIDIIEITDNEMKKGCCKEENKKDVVRFDCEIPKETNLEQR
ncbi:uncharacterized protein LOC100577113 isoform X4 [Apis mellifera]|uniref:Uncharacterized protein LOC100577113 isoform X4 n=1 Tax=Apis mellifera TaxID=7460 RepID=A0A7M7MWK5_APIME|nr:uncharacterized protein LOC100577113 isoform X4 [Apis mellifera]|eukprot:XP_026301811.1 uncharacterized protein LOC100577113 isoform X4 [Apis mellifera]